MVDFGCPPAEDATVTPDALPATRHLVECIWSGLGGEPGWVEQVALGGTGAAPSAFAASDLAQASIAVAGLAVAELLGTTGRPASARAATGGAAGAETGPAVAVDRSRASAWFVASYRPSGWTVPPAWDAVAGDYRSQDRWIRLHTNAPHHRAAALDVLDLPPGAAKPAVAAAVAAWNADDLEQAIVEAGGASAAMRSTEEWAQHPQGSAVADEPLMYRATHSEDRTATSGRRSADPARPLAGVRVLDLTRVLAGPVSTRFLAGYGAQVLRIDPLDWDEPPLVPDVTVGKHCARVDLRHPAGRELLFELLGSADVFVHGYRPGALEQLGLGEAVRREHRPGLVDVSLDAYGWTGPWADRRGFDSLVQMSSGIAEAGMRWSGVEAPAPLPFQALDHATGYLLAAAAVRGLTTLSNQGRPTTWRTSLARTAALLVEAGPGDGGGDLAAVEPQAQVERTAWGELRRLPSPVAVGGHGLAWDGPARPLGTDQAAW
jgi:CoA-transferase family III